MKELGMFCLNKIAEKPYLAVKINEIFSRCIEESNDGIPENKVIKKGKEKVNELFNSKVVT